METTATSLCPCGQEGRMKPTIEAVPGFLDGRLATRATTPLKAARARCLYCAGTWAAVRTCPRTNCALYPFARTLGLRKSRAIAQNAQTPASDTTPTLLKIKGQLQTGMEQIARQETCCESIRKHCVWCCGGESYKEVELCVEPSCPLFRWRFGSRPTTAKKLGKPVNPKTILRGDVLYLASENS